MDASTRNCSASSSSAYSLNHEHRCSCRPIHSTAQKNFKISRHLTTYITDLRRLFPGNPWWLPRRIPIILRDLFGTICSHRLDTISACALPIIPTQPKRILLSSRTNRCHRSLSLSSSRNGAVHITLHANSHLITNSFILLT